MVYIRIMYVFKLNFSASAALIQIQVRFSATASLNSFEFNFIKGRYSHKMQQDINFTFKLYKTFEATIIKTLLMKLNWYSIDHSKFI